MSPAPTTIPPSASSEVVSMSRIATFEAMACGAFSAGLRASGNRDCRVPADSGDFSHLYEK
jgi:hypothetical protein